MSGVRGHHGNDPSRLGRPGSSLGRPWPGAYPAYMAGTASSSLKGGSSSPSVF